jgi:hypothetical protein
VFCSLSTQLPGDQPAVAQREIPKAVGHDEVGAIDLAGFVDTAGFSATSSTCLGLLERLGFADMLLLRLEEWPDLV